ncbi:MAG: SpaA isopeptide-forming pilin-related protein [Bifidobacterium sp.]|uniref:SpaA isopeptide-forming pilin-related protein n=1 Tax=Bifidobacterium fermentum TaxID=3059035 RepID=A0AB39UIV9_9BIFI
MGKLPNITSNWAKAALVALIAFTMLVSVSLADGHAASADSSTTGSTLVSEDFTESSVSDSRWLAFGDACLTAASASPMADASKLGVCAKTEDTAYLAGQSDGFLQLTDNSAGSTSDVLYNRAIPTSAGLDISFYQYQFATSDTGLGEADGIGFFLTDGSYTLDQPGPTGSNYGGALGYASIGDKSGIDNGVLGVGLDVYGNYANQPYVGTSCSTSNLFSPSSISLRGQGSGTDGYCLLKNGNGTYSTSNDALKTSAPAVSQSGADNGSLVHIVVSPVTEANPLPTVTISVNDTVVSSYQLTTALPSLVKFGFASSTGGGHSAHMVRLTSVKSVEPMDALNLVKTVNHDVTNGGTLQKVFKAGDTVPYSFEVSNTGNETLKGIKVTDPKISNIQCAEPAGGLTVANSMTCTGTYGPLTAAEASAGHFDNTAVATAQNEEDQTVTSNESSATIPTYTTGNLAVTKKVTGSGASAVDEGDSYSVNYSYPAGAYQYCSADGTATASDTDEQYAAGSGTLQVKADGTAVSSSQIPTGAKVELSEVQPSNTSSINWESPSFSPQSVTIGCQGTTSDVQLTNTADQVSGSVSWKKTDAAASGTMLAGSQWELTKPDGSTETVVDNGQNDADSVEGQLKVSDLAWGEYSLKETKAPTGYVLNAKPYSFKVDSKDLNVSLGSIANTAGNTGLVLKKTSDPASGSTVKRGQTITYSVTAHNTGNVDLPAVVVTDDMSKVLNAASFVDGSAKASIYGVDAGSVTKSGTLLSWKGDLAAGRTVTIKYQVKVSDSASNGASIVNMISGNATPPDGFTPPTSNCTSDNQAANPDCTTTAKVVVPSNPAKPSNPARPSTSGGTSTSTTPKSSLAKTGADVALAVYAAIAMLVAGMGVISAARKKSGRSR